MSRVVSQGITETDIFYIPRYDLVFGEPENHLRQTGILPSTLKKIEDLESTYCKVRSMDGGRSFAQRPSAFQGVNEVRSFI